MNSKNPPQYLKIADAARLVGVSTSTLRLWEKHGLCTPTYTESGYRRYSQNDLERIAEIRRYRVVQGLNMNAIKAMLDSDTDSQDAAHPLHAVPGSKAGELGGKLKALRNSRGLSLEQVSRQSGVSRSLISLVEKTSSGTSVSSLRKLAIVYGTTITKLIGEKDQESATAIVRQGNGRVIPMLGNDIRIEQLAEGNQMLDCQRWTLEPGAGSSDAYCHEGEEFISVQSGTFEVTLDGRERHVLETGDSICFRSNRPHSWKNPGEDTTVLLWVNTPPSF